MGHLLCALGLHRRVQVIDEVDALNVSPTGAGMSCRVVRQHVECTRRHCRWNGATP